VDKESFVAEAAPSCAMVHMQAPCARRAACWLTARVMHLPNSWTNCCGGPDCWDNRLIPHRRVARRLDHFRTMANILLLASCARIKTSRRRTHYMTVFFVLQENASRGYRYRDSEFGKQCDRSVRIYMCCCHQCQLATMFVGCALCEVVLERYYLLFSHRTDCSGEN
jgi:hypothetical protein